VNFIVLPVVSRWRPRFADDRLNRSRPELLAQEQERERLDQFVTQRLRVVRPCFYVRRRDEARLAVGDLDYRESWRG
jgi:hypothetical protein